MRHVTLGAILELHRRIIEQSGGAAGVLSLGAIESALQLPLVTLAGRDLYPTPAEKGAALAFSIITNRPFSDGNRRVGYAAMEMFLVLNGYEIAASVVETETEIRRVASGQMDREEFATWVRDHMQPLP
jgi:death on curing protein